MAIFKMVHSQKKLYTENSKHRALPKIDPKNNLYLQKIGSTSEIANIEQTHSTSNYAILNKYIKGDKNAQEITVNNIKNNLNKINEPVKASTSEKESSIIRQSSGVDSLQTLKDIFNKNEKIDNSRKKNEEELKKKPSRNLNDEQHESNKTENLLDLLDEETLKILNIKDQGQFLTRVRIDEDKDDHDIYVFGHQTLRKEYEADLVVPKPKENDSDEEEVLDEVPIHERFHIKDLTKVGSIAQDMRDAFKEKIIGALQNELMVKKLEISYQNYENINSVRKKYHYFQDSLDKNAQDYFDLIDFITNFILNSELDPIVNQALKAKSIEFDEENHGLLLELMHKLDSEVKRFARELMVTFKTYISELDQLHYDQDIKDFDKVKQMVEIASNMCIFENDVIEKVSKNIKELSYLAVNNPRYHHLESAFEAEPKATGDFIPAEKAIKKLERGAGEYIKNSSLIIFGLLVWFI